MVMMDPTLREQRASLASRGVFGLDMFGSPSCNSEKNHGSGGSGQIIIIINNSLTWIVRPFGDDSPYNLPRWFFFPGKVSSKLNRIQSQDLPRDNSAKFPEVSMKKTSVGHLPLHVYYRRIVRITVSSHKNLHGFVWKWGILSII